MTTRRQLWLVACLVLAVGWACGDSGTSLGPTSFDVSGDWYWEESLQDPALSLACFDSGGIAVTQDGPRLTAAGQQNGYCSGPAGTSPFGAPFAMTAGTIAGTTARFRIEPCPYQGTLHGIAPDSLTGTITCTARVQNTVVHLTGTWRFLRNRPP